MKVALAEIDLASTDITSGVATVLEEGCLTLRFEFDRDGSLYSGGVAFSKVRAHRWRAERHCTTWHIDGAYDTIVEVYDSSWTSELLLAEPAETRGQWVLRHFMIYLDSAGCYEVVAEAWRFLTEEAIQ